MVIDPLILKDFFFWCTVINSGIYALTALATVAMRTFICNIQLKLFDMDQTSTLASIQKYLANFKLFITVFNFTPWVALMIINQ